MAGRTENNALGELRRGSRRCIGQFVDVVITEALPNSLRGRIRHEGRTESPSRISIRVMPSPCPR